MLTMADMGMMEHDGDMKGMNGKPRHSSPSSGASEDHSSHHGDRHAVQEALTHAPSHGRELPTHNLPERLMHGPEMHGPGSITMAHSHYRRVSEPGVGLGRDGWRVLTYSQLRSKRACAMRGA